MGDETDSNNQIASDSQTVGDNQTDSDNQIEEMSWAHMRTPRGCRSPRSAW